MAANTTRSTRQAGPTARPSGSKRKSAGRNGGGRKTDPDVVEAASREVEAIESPVGADNEAAAPRATRRGGARVGGPPTAAESTPATGELDDGDQSAVAGEAEPLGTRATERAASAGKAAAGGVLARVAAVGDYGAALTEYGRDGLTKVGAAVRQSASAVGQAAADSATRGKELAARGWDSYPLVFCGAALAVGVVAGLLLPNTKVEDNLMGKAADRLNGRVRKTATELADKSRSLADKAIGQAKAVTAAAAGDEGLTPQAIGQKVKRVAGRVKQAVVEAVEV